MNLDDKTLETSKENPEAFIRVPGPASWEKRQEAHDKREQEAHDLRALDVNSCISHRATIESYLAGQVELNREYNKIVAVNVVNVERIANALENIAESLNKPIVLVNEEP